MKDNPEKNLHAKVNTCFQKKNQKKRFFFAQDSSWLFAKKNDKNYDKLSQRGGNHFSRDFSFQTSLVNFCIMIVNLSN